MDSETSTAPAGRHWATLFGVKAHRYRNLLKKRWWIPAIAVSIGLAAEAWVLMSQPVLFESTGTIVIGGSVNFDSTTHYTEQDDGNYGTQIKILQSAGFQNRVKQAVALISPQTRGTAELLASIVPRTNTFSVTVHGSSPEYTQVFAQTAMEEYIKFRGEDIGGALQDQMKGMTDQLKQTRAELETERKALQDYTEKNDMVFWKESKQNAIDMLTSLKKQEASKTNELQQLQNLTADQILSRDAGALQMTQQPPAETNETNDPSAPSATGDGTAIGNDLSMKYLTATQDLAQKQAELEEKQKVWKPKHPGIKRINDEIDRLQLLIKTIKGQNQESTQARAEGLKAEIKSLDASIADWDKKVLEASRKDSEYQMLEGSLSSTQHLYDKLVESIKGGAVGVTGQEHVTILDHASDPVRVPPGVVKHLLIGLFLGLGAGIGILYVLDRADDRITSSTEMIDYFSEPILGQIPDVDDSRVESGLPLLQPDDARYTFAESFRSLRSSLIFMPNQGELKTLVVTSSIPGEGKSTISANLAVTMSLAGAKVLLVDADLRRGDLASIFDVDGRVGLSSVLRGEVEWKAALQKTMHPTLSLLPRGPVTNQSGELLLVPAFEKLMSDFKNEYDLTIFNTSPILATDDTATIAPNFDGTLMVIRAQFTGARLAHNSLNALYQRQVNVLGLILNCIDTEMPDYYYYRYPKYYAV